MEETRGKIEFWDGHESKNKEMTWCNDSDDDRALQIITATSKENTNVLDPPKTDDIRNTITCPSCGQDIEFQDQVHIFIILYSFFFLVVSIYICLSSCCSLDFLKIYYLFIWLVLLLFTFLFLSVFLINLCDLYRPEFMICRGYQQGWSLIRQTMKFLNI